MCLIIAITSIESVFQMIIRGNNPAVLAGEEGKPIRT